jgi:hypothetical protein
VITRRLINTLGRGLFESTKARFCGNALCLGFNVTVNIAVGGRGSEGWYMNGAVTELVYGAAPENPNTGGVCGSRLGRLGRLFGYLYGIGPGEQHPENVCCGIG